ncbi:hypothetical protein CYMTET_8726, partial [Cymbomonas tetramitiformis]
VIADGEDGRSSRMSYLVEQLVNIHSVDTQKELLRKGVLDILKVYLMEGMNWQLKKASETLLLKILRLLHQLPIKRKHLQESKIGKNVKKVRKHPSAEVRNIVNGLMQKWVTEINHDESAITDGKAPHSTTDFAMPAHPNSEDTNDIGGTQAEKVDPAVDAEAEQKTMPMPQGKDNNTARANARDTVALVPVTPGFLDLNADLFADMPEGPPRARKHGAAKAAMTDDPTREGLHLGTLQGPVKEGSPKGRPAASSLPADCDFTHTSKGEEGRIPPPAKRRRDPPTEKGGSKKACVSEPEILEALQVNEAAAASNKLSKGLYRWPLLHHCRIWHEEHKIMQLHSNHQTHGR